MRSGIPRSIAVSLALALAGGAAALADPVGVTSTEGILRGPDGRPLYFNDNDILNRGSTCNDACAMARPPLLAGKSDKADGAWFVVGRKDGTSMWTRLNLPLYSYVGDQPNGPATGAGGSWRVAYADAVRSVGGGRVSTSPHPSPTNPTPEYPEAARMIHAEGIVGLTMCVDEAGRPSQVKLVQSSGFDILDTATVDWAAKLVLLPGKVNSIVAKVCGYVIQYQWQLREN